MSALNQLLANLKVEANVFHNGQYCGMWAVDTSGSQKMSFHVVTHGQCFFSVGQRQHKLSAGDAVFLPHDSKHIVSNLATSDVEANKAASIAMGGDLQSDGTGLVCGHFSHNNPVFDRLTKQLPEAIVVRKAGATEGMVETSARIIELLLTESIHSDQSSNVLLNRLSDCLLYILLRDHLDTGSGVFAAMADPRLSKAMDLIHAETQSKWSVEELASAAALSRSGFSSLFKDVVGQTVSEYVTQWRMTQAYRWLADDGISTLAAALNSGYESEASFSKAFKRVMGVGPGQVRKAKA